MKKLSLIFALFLCVNLVAQEQTVQVLCIGNSFTYYNDAYKLLQQLSESEGHPMKINAQLVGGYSFCRHLNRDETMAAILDGRFDYVFLQDQSRTPAYYGQDPKRCKLLLRDTKELLDRIRIYSPKATIWIEQTWAYSGANYGGFGSFEEFDRLLHLGTVKLAKKTKIEVSPIGVAFAICRAERPDINLYAKDNHHQSALGAYLKACVNYQLIFGKPFTENATDCGNDPEQAAYLRSLAERVVLGL